MMVELINAIGGVAFEEAWKNKISGKYGAVTVYFISRQDLLKSKKAAGRPQDLRDIDELGGFIENDQQRGMAAIKFKAPKVKE